MVNYAEQEERDWGFAHRLKRVLKEERCTVEHLAAGCDLSVGYVYRLLQARQQPSFKTVCAIADYLLKPLDTFRP